MERNWNIKVYVQNYYEIDKIEWFKYFGSFWLFWRILLFFRWLFELNIFEKKLFIIFLLFYFQFVNFMLRIDVIMYGNVVVLNNDLNNEDIYNYVLFIFVLIL